MAWSLPALVGLACAQVIFYRISSKQAVKDFPFLALFYCLTFLFIKGLLIFCDLYSASLYALPLVLLTLVISFGREPTQLPVFQKCFRQAPAFYLLTSFWVSLIWFAQDLDLAKGLSASFLAAFLLPILAGIKERLQLTDAPRHFAGVPLLVISAGIILLGLHFLI